MKGMIFAAGLGTRLYPITKSIPKALAQYNNKPLLQHVIEKITKAGFDEIIVNVHHFAQKVIEFLENNNFHQNIIISEETDLLLETGGGLFKAAKYFRNEAFLVHNVDILSDIDLRQMYEYHLKNNSIATLAVQNRESGKRLYFNEENALCKWKNEKTGEEKPARNCGVNAKPFAFSGIHVIDSKIFSFMHEGKYSIIDTYLKAAQTEKITFFDHTGGKWADMGKPESFDIDLFQ